MNNVELLNENWILKYNGENLKATVPGDVTLDLYANGKIKNPYFPFELSEAKRNCL